MFSHKHCTKLKQLAISCLVFFDDEVSYLSCYHKRNSGNWLIDLNWTIQFLRIIVISYVMKRGIEPKKFIFVFIPQPFHRIHLASMMWAERIVIGLNHPSMSVRSDTRSEQAQRPGQGANMEQSLGSGSGNEQLYQLWVLFNNEVWL